jgi:hypothetical protein
MVPNSLRTGKITGNFYNLRLLRKDITHLPVTKIAETIIGLSLVSSTSDCFNVPCKPLKHLRMSLADAASRFDPRVGGRRGLTQWIARRAPASASACCTQRFPIVSQYPEEAGWSARAPAHITYL